MPIQTIIKSYFYFLLVVLSFAALSYNPSVNMFYASAFDSVEGMGIDIMGLSEIKVSVVAVDEGYEANKTNSVNRFFGGAKLEGVFNFEVNRDGLETYARAGDTNVGVMNLWMKSGGKEMKLRYLRLRLFGAVGWQVKNVALVYGEEVLAYAENVDEFYEFKGVNFSVDENSEDNLKVVADIDLSLSVNDRIRFDIENPSDIVLEYDRDAMDLKQSFPIKGAMISVVGGKRSISDLAE